LSIVLAISFRHFLTSDLALYHIIFYVLYHHHLDEIEGGLEKSERQKDQASSRDPNFHVPARCAVCTGSRPPKGQLGRNWLTLSTLKQGAIRVDRLPQEASGRWYLRNLARLVGAAFQLFDIHAMGAAVCNKAETARQCTLARPKIPSSCHKAETRQRDQGF
jgi:hypothetical protein